MTEESRTKGVSFGLNLLLTLAFLFQSLASFLFEREDLTKGKAHLSTFPFIKDHVMIEGIVGITSMVVAIVLFVWMVLQVWNRVISRRLDVQEIALPEAYAITLLFFAITSWI